MREVFVQPADPPQQHSADDAPLEHGPAVETEVDAEGPQQQREHLVETASVLSGQFAIVPPFRWLQIGMAGDLRQFGGDPGGRAYDVHAPARHRASRHAVVCRRSIVLREGDTAFELDGLDAERAVRSRA